MYIKNSKKLIAVVIAVVYSISSPLCKTYAAQNEVPYQTYTYDKWGNANPAPNGYLPERSIRGAEYSIGEFSSPEDLFYCKERGEVYIADTGNQRIVVLDESMQFLRLIEELWLNGEAYVMQKPTGIFVDKDGSIYIADQGKSVIIKCSQDLNIIEIYGKPESNLITEDFDYKPNKIVVDSYGKIYVQAVGMFQGLINMKPDGTFIKYYGANKVEMTTKRILQKFWKTILSDSASQNMQTFNPIEYGNIFLAGDDFIYAVAAATENNRQMLVKLNPLGIDVFNTVLQMRLVSSFADVSVDEDGIMTFADTKTGMIYQNDKTGRLIFAFGGIGDQLGLFKRPTALIEAGEKIFVLDGDKNDITVFGLTTFGIKVRDAINLYNEGLYLDSIEPWMEVIKLNANYLLAYTGIGKAYYQTEQYTEAMYYYKLANDKKNYSDAFKEYSLLVMRDNFARIVILAVISYIGFTVIKIWMKKRKLSRKGAPI